MRLTYANCFPSEEHLGDVIATDEVAVAGSIAARPVRSFDADIDGERAQKLNLAVWELAFSWFQDEERDVTRIDGLSVGDIAGLESAISILFPAVRGLLGAQIASRDYSPTDVTVVLPPPQPHNYSRIERLQGMVFGHALTELGGAACTYATSSDPRNELLARKYERARDPAWPTPETSKRALARRVLRLAETVGSLTPRASRPSLVVVEYGTTRAFATGYAAMTGRRRRLIRVEGSPRRLGRATLAGDCIVLPFAPSRRSSVVHASSDVEAAVKRAGATLRHRFLLEGFDLWPLVGPALANLVARYGPFCELAFRQYRARLQQWRVGSVLVPFDTPPDARILVRAAQSLGVPTFVISDGFKCDDFSYENMTADTALAWSASLRDHYLSRRSDGPAVITGNPKADRLLVRAPASTGEAGARILVGSFTFSPIDLNCRRSDPERFLADVFEGIRGSTIAIEQVVVKLHPADFADHYGEILKRYAALPVHVVAGGDVLDLLSQFDLYVTTYSTSLIEAVARSVPVIYYRCNEQRLHEPFSNDLYIAGRTAASPAELTCLLDAPPPDFASVDDRLEWTERYLGPQDGRSVERIVRALDGWRPPGLSAQPSAENEPPPEASA